MAIFSVIGAGGKEETSKQVLFTIKANEWPTAEPYEITIQNEEITSHMNGDINLAQIATLEERYVARHALFYVKQQGKGYITLGIDGDVPEIDIPMALTIFPKSSSAGDEEFVRDELYDHVNDRSNPHRVTAEQIGAVGIGEVNKIQNNLDTHISNKNNPHGTTIEQITNNKIYIDANGNVHFAGESGGEGEEPETATILINNQPVATQSYVAEATTINYDDIAFDVNEIV